MKNKTHNKKHKTGSTCRHSKNAKKPNIVLIGFAGVGKTTLARVLHVKLKGYTLIDTDTLIEDIFSLSIERIFERFGERSFRKAEKKVIKILTKDKTPKIISTGGGIIHAKSLQKLGKIIYLKSKFKPLYKRLKTKNELQKRPLMQNKKNAKTLHVKRQKIYKNIANSTLHVKQKSPQKIAIKITKLYM